MLMKYNESIRACQYIDGWKLVTSFSVGGFEWLGFSKEISNKMIIISSQKTTILDCNNGKIENCRGIIRMCEQVAASGNTLILYSA